MTVIEKRIASVQDCIATCNEIIDRAHRDIATAQRCRLGAYRVLDEIEEELVHESALSGLSSVHDVRTKPIRGQPVDVLGL